MKKIISLFIVLSVLLLSVPISACGISAEDKLSAKLIAEDYFGPSFRMTENDISYIHLGEYGDRVEVFYVTYASEVLYTTAEIRETYGGVEFFFSNGNVIRVYCKGEFYWNLGLAYDAGLLTPEDLQEIHDRFYGVAGKKTEGDINGDGKITAGDLFTVVNAVCDFEETLGYRYEYDINRDKAINAKDHLKIKLIIKGI